MMPQTEASLPSVEQVQKIINLVKSIIFPDYFNKRQCHETIRSYNIGVHMEELLQTLARQISYGLQFGEIIFSYPVTKAMIYYRIAHKLHELQVPVIPSSRIMSPSTVMPASLAVSPSVTTPSSVATSG